MKIRSFKVSYIAPLKIIYVTKYLIIAHIAIGSYDNNLTVLTWKQKFLLSLLCLHSVFRDFGDNHLKDVKEKVV